MAAITYTIKNLSQNNKTAIINAFDITTNLSQQQHYLNLSGWNPPFNSYTSFAGDTTRRTETKIFQGDVRTQNFIIDSFQGTSITFTKELSEIDTNWTPVGNPFQNNQTITIITGTTATFSASFDIDPVIGDSISFIPPQYLLYVNDVNNLDIGWTIEGIGYNGQTILDILPPNTLVISAGANIEPPSGSILTFTSDFDNMFEIPAGGSKTFSMDYTNVTSTLGTYTSLVQIYATLDGTEVIKNVNNFMVISAFPVIDPISPYYGDSDSPADVGVDCGDTGSSNDCSI